MFPKAPATKVSLHGLGLTEPYWVLLDSEFWKTHILFRDFLRVHPNAAQQYQALKRKLAVEFRYNRERYTDSKAPLIEQLLVQARAWQQAF